MSRFNLIRAGRCALVQRWHRLALVGLWLVTLVAAACGNHVQAPPESKDIPAEFPTRVEPPSVIPLPWPDTLVARDAWVRDGVEPPPSTLFIASDPTTPHVLAVVANRGSSSRAIPVTSSNGRAFSSVRMRPRSSRRPRIRKSASRAPVTRNSADQKSRVRSR